MLAAVVALGVAVGAVSNSTVVGITVLWIVLYGSGLLMSLLPSNFPTPEKVLSRLPNVLRGAYDLTSLLDWILGAAIAMLLSAIVGMLAFSRRDV